MNLLPLPRPRQQQAAERRRRTASPVRRLWLLVLGCWTALPFWLAPSPVFPADNGAPPFPPFCDAAERRQILQALEAAAPIAPRQETITGLTLPHHLLAADLMAQGFRLAAGQKPARLIILCPDHFRRSKTAFAVPDRDFATFLGPVPLDRDGARRLLELPQVSVSALFSHEHGVRALLPFAARLFPDTPVLPVALRGKSAAQEQEALFQALTPLVQDALVIQSTDFSHEQPPEIAARFDAETLAVLTVGNADQAIRLDPVRHVDSPAALALQMRLQAGQGSIPQVLVNRNSAEYAPKNEAPPRDTTSYVLALWTPAAKPFVPETASALVLAGDLFSGGRLAPMLRNPALRRLFVERVRRATNGAALVVNLEGFLAPECPSERSIRLCMAAEPTAALLKELGVVAVSLANNHSLDGGPAGLDFTRKQLAQAGILALGQDEMGELAVQGLPCRLVAFTDVDNHPAPRRFLLNEARIAATLARARRDFSGPVLVLLHFGVEFAPIPGHREREIAALCLKHGANLVAGSHPHRAGRLSDGTGKGAGRLVAWSLGNFLFDDAGLRANGALLHLTLFPQGTCWMRQIPWGNPYRDLLAARRAAFFHPAKHRVEMRPSCLKF